MYFSTEWFETELSKIPDKKEKLNLTLVFVTSASDFISKECFEIVQRLKKEAEAENNTDLLAFALLYISFFYKATGQPEKGQADFEKAEMLIEKSTHSFASAIVAQMIAFEYWGAGKRDKAFELAFKSLKMAQAHGGEGIGWAHFQLGVFHFDLKDYDKSIDFFHQSEKQSKELGLTYQLARTQSGIGGVYIAKGDLENALKYNSLALEGYRKTGHLTAISRALNDLGVISFKKNNIGDAKKYLREALKIRTDLSYSPGIITSGFELAKVLLSEENYEEGEKLLLDALALSEKTTSLQKAATIHLLLVDLYKKKKDPWKALDHIEKANALKAEIAGEEASNRIKHLQQKFATEKADQEAEIHRLKNVELKKAYGEIEEKNKSILDSIHYAKRIQNALLPSEKSIDKLLKRLKDQ